MKPSPPWRWKTSLATCLTCSHEKSFASEAARLASRGARGEPHTVAATEWAVRRHRAPGRALPCRAEPVAADRRGEELALLRRRPARVDDRERELHMGEQAD